jgi:hypothetical protein
MLLISKYIFRGTLPVVRIIFFVIQYIESCPQQQRATARRYNQPRNQFEGNKKGYRFQKK